MDIAKSRPLCETSAVCCGNSDRLSSSWGERIASFRTKRVDFLTDERKRGEGKRLLLRCCCGGGGGGGRVFLAEENEKFVKMMREAQPYFLAHRGSTFVVLLSAEVIDSSLMESILEVIISLPPSLEFLFLCLKW